MAAERPPSPGKSWHGVYPSDSFDPERLLSRDMAALLASACDEYGDAPAYSCVLPNGTYATLSYRELEQYSAACAFYLRAELGLESGDVVAVQSPNCLGYPIAAFGVLRAGLTLTGINPLYTVAETNFQLKDSGAKVLFVIDLYGDRLRDALDGTQVAHVVRLSVADFFSPFQRMAINIALKYVQKRLPDMTVPSISLADALKKGDAHRGRGAKRRSVDELRAGRGLDDVILFQYTGGTTGRSKGAEITERNLLANITQQDSFTGDVLRASRTGRDASLLVLPLYHVYALGIGSMHALRSGIHLIMAPNPRPLSNLKPAFEKFNITVLPGINTLFNELLKQDWFIQNPPENLRWCFSGAAPLSEATRARWESLTGCRIYEGYGLTEGTCVVASPPLDARAKPGTVGVPIPGTDLRIVDGEGKDQPPGVPGEVIVRGPQIMRGYLRRPEATEETIRDGWLYTGDIGVLDDDGFLSIVDRKKDMIIVSGFNVYPAELEDVITGHDAVAEAAVVGVVDEKCGEVPWAYVVARDPGLGLSDLKTYCDARLTNYKRPRRYVLMDELPKSPVGKVLRRTLRDMAAAAKG